MTIKEKVARYDDKLSGSKGKGGGGQTFREDENTLQASQTVKTVFGISEGQCGGLAAGARSIFVNNLPLQNADGSYNFGGKIAWDQRQGLPDQSYMAGFPSAASEFSVGVEVTTTTPRTQTTSTADIDAVRVTLGLPNGLYEQKTDSNHLTGGVVSVAIDRKLSSSGTWAQALVVTFDGKTTSPYAASYRIERPTGTGTWDVRVRRLTADNAAATLKNNTWWNSYTEIQDVRLPYNNTALVGVALTARDLGTQNVPTVSFDWYGQYVKIPSNYNPYTRVYTGTWDGTWKYDWTDNPAWCLYDVLTRPVANGGMGLTDNRVSRYGFYAAAVYNDGMVDNGYGGTEPRFTCNVPIQAQDEALRVCQNLASVMRAKIMWSGGYIRLIQDRPASSVKLLTTANAIDGMFDYASSTLDETYTAANVIWNNPAEHYLQSIERVDASTETGSFRTALQSAQASYGLRVKEEVAFACTSQGQARRHGRWLLDSVLYQTEFCKWKMSLEGFDLQVGDVVTIFDAYYAGQQNGGRVKTGSTTTTIQLDRPVTLTTGSTISLMLPNGIETKPITATTGTVSAVTVSSAFSSAPAEYTNFIVTTTVPPRQFRITSIKESDQPNIIDLEALLYDPIKYSRVETGAGIPTPAGTYTATPGSLPAPPTAVTFRESTSTTDGIVKRKLHVGWTASTSSGVVKYSVQYRQANDLWQTVETTANTVQIPDVDDGLFEARVYAVNHLGSYSAFLYGSYTVSTSYGTGSALDAVANLQEASTGSANAFTTLDLNVKWTNPVSNGTKTVPLKDFEVKVVDSSTAAVIRTEYVPAVAGGSVQRFTYSYSQNNADTNNSPRRAIQIQVRCRDVNNKVSPSTTATFTNAAPALPTGMTITPGVGNVKITYTLPTDPDFKGVLIWRSTTTGFTPSSANLVYDTTDNYISDSGLTAGTAYYYRVAAYDAFLKPLNGSGLTLSSEIAATPAQTGIPKGASNPGSGVQGDYFFNTTDNKLYRYTGSAWTAAVPAVDITGQITGTQIAADTITGNNIAANAITSSELAANSVVAGKIAAATITSSEIAAGTITAGNIAANTITSDRIASGTITGTNIAAGTITGTHIVGNTIQGGHIIAGNITGGHIAAGTIGASHIAANTITAGSAILGDLSVTSIKIANGAVSAAYSASTSGATTTSVSVTVVVPSGARSLTLLGFLGSTYWVEYDGKGGSIEHRNPAVGTIQLSGSIVDNSVGSGGWTVTNPTAGTYTATATRSTGGVTCKGNLTIVALVTFK